MYIVFLKNNYGHTFRRTNITIQVFPEPCWVPKNPHNAIHKPGSIHAPYVSLLFNQNHNKSQVNSNMIKTNCEHA